MTPLLPQQDPRPDRRAAELDKARTRYRFDYTRLTPLALAAAVPFGDEFELPWLAKAGESALAVLANHVAIEADAGRRAAQQKSHSLLGALLKAAKRDLAGVRELVEEALGAVEDTGHFASLEDYAKLFVKIERPPSAGDWKSDASFARMRVAGPNPVMIRAVPALDDRFPVTEGMYRQTLAGDSLAAAGQEGRLFLADYRELAGIVNGTFPGEPKFSHAPLALFAVDKGSRRLMPVAIQCGQQPGPGSPIFTPDGSLDWLMARNVVEVADGNYHQAISHLGRTHMFVEPFVIATRRQLADNHPLGLLLRPHFQGTLAINKAAVEQLAAPGGSVDELLAGTIQSTLALTATGVDTYRVNEAMLPAALASRGVNDPGILPDYPYRDDALLYWGAIREWVDAYLRLYYVTDADVQGDTELAAWYQELASRDGGRVQGLDTGAAAGSLNYLVDVTTLVIFTASVQHAAVNFAQYDPMSFIPSMPLACYQPARTSRTGATTADFLAMLSPNKPALRQLALGYMLGTLHYGKLGDYDSGTFPDKRVKAPLKALQARLESIGNTIDQRNQTRTAYRLLAASGIPQSINV